VRALLRAFPYPRAPDLGSFPPLSVAHMHSTVCGICAVHALTLPLFSTCYPHMRQVSLPRRRAVVDGTPGSARALRDRFRGATSGWPSTARATRNTNNVFFAGAPVLAGRTLWADVGRLGGACISATAPVTAAVPACLLLGFTGAALTVGLLLLPLPSSWAATGAGGACPAACGGPAGMGCSAISHAGCTLTFPLVRDGNGRHLPTYRLLHLPNTSPFKTRYLLRLE